MDMSKKYEMSGSPADSNSIEFDVYLGKLTVTTQGTYGYIYNRKTRESILCLKKEDYDKAVKRLFNIDMNSSKDDVPNIVVNENGYKIATSSTGKSYISKLAAEPDTHITDTLESDTDDSCKNNSKENCKTDGEDKPFDDSFFDDLVHTEPTSTELTNTSSSSTTNTSMSTNTNTKMDNTDSLKEKLEKIKLEEYAALKNEHENEHEDNKVLYGKYNSDVSFANAYNKKMQQQAASIPEEYINHCNIDPKDVKTDSGSDVFARYANMTFNIIPIPPEAEQNVHVCEDIHKEDIHKENVGNVDYDSYIIKIEDRIETKFSKGYVPKNSNNKWGTVHGDLTFSNILINEYDEFVFIDPRGTEVKLGDDEYIIVKQSDILAVVSE
jgi:co-chaperonin GroES (HSP10)